MTGLSPYAEILRDVIEENQITLHDRYDRDERHLMIDHKDIDENQKNLLRSLGATLTEGKSGVDVKYYVPLHLDIDTAACNVITKGFVCLSFILLAIMIMIAGGIIPAHGDMYGTLGALFFTTGTSFFVVGLLITVVWEARIRQYKRNLKASDYLSPEFFAEGQKSGCIAVSSMILGIVGMFGFLGGLLVVGISVTNPCCLDGRPSMTRYRDACPTPGDVPHPDKCTNFGNVLVWKAFSIPSAIFSALFAASFLWYGRKNFYLSTKVEMAYRRKKEMETETQA